MVGWKITPQQLVWWTWLYLQISIHGCFLVECFLNFIIKLSNALSKICFQKGLQFEKDCGWKQLPWERGVKALVFVMGSYG
jgi:hypothetical protein